MARLPVTERLFKRTFDGKWKANGEIQAGQFWPGMEVRGPLTKRLTVKNDIE
jgi:hypothetical protein